MLKIAPKEVHFLKSADAIVETQSQSSWKDLIHQRIRWTSKTAKQKSSFSKTLGLVVFLSNFLILLGLLYSIISPHLLPYYVAFFVAKGFLDFYVIQTSNTFFKNKMNAAAFLISVFYYPIITVLVVLGSLKGTYSWKGRNFEKQP